MYSDIGYSILLAPNDLQITQLELKIEHLVAVTKNYERNTKYNQSINLCFITFGLCRLSSRYAAIIKA